MNYAPELKHGLIAAHWQMLDSLFTELLMYRPGELALKGEYLAHLFSTASRDPRFEAIGMSRHSKGYMIYTSPDGIEYLSDAAPAAMLGLAMKSPTTSTNHRGERITHCRTLATPRGATVLYRDWANSTEFRWWLRWEAQKSRGYTDKALHFNTGYQVNKVRDFPDTLSIINELYPQKDSAL